MLLWTTPFGRRTFGLTAEFAQSTRALAANQGLYNGFLAAGLLWGLLAYGVHGGRPILTFFLACVLVAGAFGAPPGRRRILLVPAGSPPGSGPLLSRSPCPLCPSGP